MALKMDFMPNGVLVVSLGGTVVQRLGSQDAMRLMQLAYTESITTSLPAAVVFGPETERAPQVA